MHFVTAGIHKKFDLFTERFLFFPTNILTKREVRGYGTL